MGQATGTRLEGAGELNRGHKYHRVLMRHSQEKSTCVTERRIRKLLEKRELRVRILKTMPDGNQKREDYQWDVIFDGNPRLLEKGVDFTCTPRGFKASAYSAAARRGITIKAIILEDGVAIERQA